VKQFDLLMMMIIFNSNGGEVDDATLIRHLFITGEVVLVCSIARLDNCA
jgi:hypothetical protein